MPNFCTPSNRIGSYVSSSSSTTTQNIITKNIDCVSLDADLVATDQLTVQGVDLSNYPDIVDKTQNMTSTPQGTSFSGPLTASSLNVTQIAANDPTLGIEIGSVVNHTMSSTTGTLMYNMLNPSLGTGSNDNMGLEIGTSKTTDNAWQMLYVNNATALSRRLDFRMRGYSTPTLCLTRGKVGVGNSAPAEALDVTGNTKISGTLSVSGVVTGSFIKSGTLLLNQTANKFQFYDIPSTAGKITLHFQNVFATVQPATGSVPFFRVGTGSGTSPTMVTTNYTGGIDAGIQSAFVPPTTLVQIYPIPSTGTFAANVKHSGDITFTYIGSSGGFRFYSYTITTFYQSGSGFSVVAHCSGNGSVGIAFSSGPITSIGLFYSETDTTNARLTAGLVNVTYF